MIRRAVLDALATVVVLLALAYGAAIAKADSTHPIENTPGGNITSASLGKIVLDTGAGVRIECNVTLRGTLASGRIEAETATQFGSITSGSVSACSGGTVSLVVEARNPWGLYFYSFLGTLPDAVTGTLYWMGPIRMLAAIESIASCLYTGRIAGLVPWSAVEGRRSTYTTGLVRVIPEQRSYTSITKLSGLFSCPTEPTISGTLSLEPQQNPIAMIGIVRPLTAENAAIVFTGTATHRYTFRNTSGANVPLNESRIVPGNVGFTIVSDNCRGAVLSVNARCDVEVRFTAPGTDPKLAQLRAMEGAIAQGQTWVSAR